MKLVLDTECSELEIIEVAPSRGRGLKLCAELCVPRSCGRRPFAGAWIETGRA